MSRLISRRFQGGRSLVDSTPTAAIGACTRCSIFSSLGARWSLSDDIIARSSTVAGDRADGKRSLKRPSGPGGMATYSNLKEEAVATDDTGSLLSPAPQAAPHELSPQLAGSADDAIDKAYALVAAGQPTERTQAARICLEMVSGVKGRDLLGSLSLYGLLRVTEVTAAGRWMAEPPPAGQQASVTRSRAELPLTLEDADALRRAAAAAASRVADTLAVRAWQLRSREELVLWFEAAAALLGVHSRSAALASSALRRSAPAEDEESPAQEPSSPRRVLLLQPPPEPSTVARLSPAICGLLAHAGSVISGVPALPDAAAPASSSAAAALAGPDISTLRLPPLPSPDADTVRAYTAEAHGGQLSHLTAAVRCLFLVRAADAAAGRAGQQHKAQLHGLLAEVIATDPVLLHWGRAAASRPETVAPAASPTYAQQPPQTPPSGWPAPALPGSAPHMIPVFPGAWPAMPSGTQQMTPGGTPMATMFPGAWPAMLGTMPVAVAGVPHAAAGAWPQTTASAPHAAHTWPQTTAPAAATPPFQAGMAGEEPSAAGGSRSATSVPIAHAPAREPVATAGGGAASFPVSAEPVAPAAADALPTLSGSDAVLAAIAALEGKFPSHATNNELPLAAARAGSSEGGPSTAPAAVGSAAMTEGRVRSPTPALPAAQAKKGTRAARLGSAAPGAPAAATDSVSVLPGAAGANSSSSGDILRAALAASQQGGVGKGDVIGKGIGKGFGKGKGGSMSKAIGNGKASFTTLAVARPALLPSDATHPVPAPRYPSPLPTGASAPQPALLPSPLPMLLPSPLQRTLHLLQLLNSIYSLAASSNSARYDAVNAIDNALRCALEDGALAGSKETQPVPSADALAIISEILRLHAGVRVPLSALVAVLQPALLECIAAAETSKATGSSGSKTAADSYVRRSLSVGRGAGAFPPLDLAGVGSVVVTLSRLNAADGAVVAAYFRKSTAFMEEELAATAERMSASASASSHRDRDQAGGDGHDAHVPAPLHRSLPSSRLSPQSPQDASRAAAASLMSSLSAISRSLPASASASALGPGHASASASGGSGNLGIGRVVAKIGSTLDPAVPARRFHTAAAAAGKSSRSRTGHATAASSSAMPSPLLPSLPFPAAAPLWHEAPAALDGETNPTAPDELPAHTSDGAASGIAEDSWLLDSSGWAASSYDAVVTPAIQEQLPSERAAPAAAADLHATSDEPVPAAETVSFSSAMSAAPNDAAAAAVRQQAASAAQKVRGRTVRVRAVGQMAQPTTYTPASHASSAPAVSEPTDVRLRTSHTFGGTVAMHVLTLLQDDGAPVQLSPGDARRAALASLQTLGQSLRLMRGLAAQQTSKRRVDPSIALSMSAQLPVQARRLELATSALHSVAKVAALFPEPAVARMALAATAAARHLLADELAPLGKLPIQRVQALLRVPANRPVALELQKLHPFVMWAATAGLLPLPLPLPSIDALPSSSSSPSSGTGAGAVPDPAASAGASAGASVGAGVSVSTGAKAGGAGAGPRMWVDPEDPWRICSSSSMAGSRPDAATGIASKLLPLPVWLLHAVLAARCEDLHSLLRSQAAKDGHGAGHKDSADRVAALNADTAAASLLPTSSSAVRARALRPQTLADIVADAATDLCLLRGLPAPERRVVIESCGVLAAAAWPSVRVAVLAQGAANFAQSSVLAGSNIAPPGPGSEVRTAQSDFAGRRLNANSVLQAQALQAAGWLVICIARHDLPQSVSQRQSQPQRRRLAQPGAFGAPAVGAAHAQWYGNASSFFEDERTGQTHMHSPLASAEDGSPAEQESEAQAEAQATVAVVDRLLGAGGVWPRLVGAAFGVRTGQRPQAARAAAGAAAAAALSVSAASGRAAPYGRLA